MGNVIMKAQQIAYGASNVEKALDDLNVPELIELNKRMDAIDAWKANVHEETYTGSELTIENALALPARSLITSINAIQDLHGYGEPWIGGAGKNKFPITVENLKTLNATGTWSGNVYTVSGGTITIVTDDGGNVTGIKANGTFNADVYMLLASVSTLNSILSGSYILNGCPSGGGESTYYIRIGSSGTDGGTGANVSTPFTGTNSYIFIKSGYTANNVLFKPMIRLSTESDASFAPYSNICPISGRTAARVDDVGKNVATTVIYKQDYVITSDGSENSVSGYCITDRIDVSANQVYVFSFTRWQAGSTDPIRVGTYKADGTFISRISIINNGDTLTVPANCAYVRLSYCNTPNQSTYLYDVQMELGSTATPYEPYAHSSATIQLGTTVYGADINWDTGVMTVKTACETFDNTTDWPEPSDRGSFAKQLLSNDTKVHSESSTFEGISNCLAARSGVAIYNGAVGINCNGRWLGFRIAGVTTRAELIAFTTATPIQVEYPLATPTTIQLTPTMLEMLKGYNRVTLADGYGEIEFKALVLGGDN